MPRATRNTKVHSGNEVSAPAKWNRWLKTRELTPSAAPNDSTTVAASSSGATSARSTSPRITGTSGEVTVKRPLAGHRLLGVAEGVLVLQAAGLEPGDAKRQRAQRHRTHHPDRAGPPRHPGADAGPQAVLGRLG